MRSGVIHKHVVPCLLALAAGSLGIPAGVDLGRDLERGVVPAQLRAGSSDLVLAQRRAVALFLALLVRRAKTNDGFGANKSGLVALARRRFQRLGNRSGV